MKPALVVLAAGASSRLGRAKALMPLDGQPAFVALLRRAAYFDHAPALVVSGPHDAEIRAAAPPDVEVLANPDWAAGRTGGLALAHGARPGRDLVIAPVDCPRVPAAAFARLGRAWGRLGAPARGWLAPRYAGALPAGRSPFGHPVIAGRELLDELAGFAPDRALRELRALADPLASEDVPWVEVLDDLDRPEDWEELSG